MFSFYHIFLLCISFISIFHFKIISCNEVPAVLWNIKGNSLRIKPSSALPQDDNVFVSTLKDILKEEANVLFFAINKLSLEDFTSEETLASSNNTLQNLQTFLDTHKYMFLSSVKKPLSKVHEVHCGVQEIVVDQSIDENVLQSISLAFDRSCVVILHISDSNIVGVKEPKPEDIEQVFQPSFEKTSKDIVGIFTATKSSWGHSNEEHYKMRNLLEADTVELADSNLLNFTGCLLMYAENATITLKAENSTVNLPLPADPEGSECGNFTSVLKLNFKSSPPYKSVTLKFNFTIKGGSWTTEAYIAVVGEKAEISDILDSKDLQAPVGYSFSCGTYELRNRNSTNSVSISFERFQVQPFKVKDKFSDSFDCVTWFTVPIWMGIFVAILFIAIVNCGVYSLFSVHTMDRFDDPKGKSISVAAAAD